MSDSKIPWTGKVWNPTTGCNKVSRGCKNCYAEIMHKRQMGMNPKKYSRPFLDGAFPYKPDLHKPSSWKKHQVIFIDSMSDLFHENIPFDYIKQVYLEMSQFARQHTYQLLTKRLERALQFFEWLKSSDLKMYYELIYNHNIWFGTSIEDQKAADERLPLLIQVPAAVRWLSCEPLVGPLILGLMGTVPKSIKSGYSLFANHINWVVCGGESTANAEPMHPTWARSLQLECKKTDTPFFFKQWGTWLPFEETAQPPYWQRCDTLQQYDSHGMNMIDPETCEAGTFKGYQWMNNMNSILLCMENGCHHASFLKMGNHSLPLLDGKEYKEYPK